MFVRLYMQACTHGAWCILDTSKMMIASFIKMISFSWNIMVGLLPQVACMLPCAVGACMHVLAHKH